MLEGCNIHLKTPRKWTRPQNEGNLKMERTPKWSWSQTKFVAKLSPSPSYPQNKIHLKWRQSQMNMISKWRWPQIHYDLKMKTISKLGRSQNQDDLKMKTTSAQVPLKWRQYQMKTTWIWRWPQNKDNLKMKKTSKWRQPQKEEIKRFNDIHKATKPNLP